MFQMKNIVRIAAVLLSLALAFGIFAGCGPHPDDPETTPAQEPKKDTLKVFTRSGFGEDFGVRVATKRVTVA